MILWLAVTAVAVVSLWHLRQDAVHALEREVRLLSLVLTDEIDRGLHGTEEGFQALRVELQDARFPVTGPNARRALETRAELMPLVRTLWLLDADGRLLSASDGSPAPAQDSFVPPLHQLTKETIALSRPFTDAGTGEEYVALAVRMNARQSHGSEWTLGAMPAKSLLGAFVTASPGADIRMAVFRDDGVRLAGSITDLPLSGEARISRRLAELPELEIRHLRDGSERMVSLHGLSRYGLKIIFTRDMHIALETWRKSAQMTAVALGLLLVISVAAVWLVLRAERRHAKAQQALLIQRSRASKLESLGTLAGGVAHDFNNVLAAILGYGEMAQDAAAPEGIQARHLDKVLKAALRGKALIERILTFSRGGAHHAIVFELEPVIDEVLGLLAGSLQPGVILERRLDAPGVKLRGDPTQAFEAIMNLCTNAMQAMPAGGMLSVQLERARIDAPRILSHSLVPAGDYLAVSVADQGKGIEPAIMEHLFEPFFTTRGADAGTGLGLAVVHGIVAELGGAIDVKSTVGAGARFTLYLPECTAGLAAEVPVAAESTVGKGQTLLVVDDEPALATLAEEVLGGLGYASLVFTDSVAALEALRSDPKQFAALITDEVMPGLSGTQLTEAIRAMGIDLPVILISGYGGALLSSRAAAAGVTRVLAKPLQRAELARVLHQLVR